MSVRAAEGCDILSAADSGAAEDSQSFGCSPSCPTGCKQLAGTGARETLRSGLVAASLQDLMSTLTAYAEALGYAPKSPSFLAQPDDGRVLSRIDLRARTGMLQEELTPIIVESVEKR